MPTHVIRPGEGLLSIAEDYGLAPQTIWSDPANAALRELRGDPNILAPGDELFVRELETKTVTAALDQRHCFRRHGIPAKLRVQVIVGDEILADQPYVLEIEGQRLEGVTDGEGVLEVAVAPRARRAVLLVGDEANPHRFEFAIGHLDPLEQLTGVQRRLRNLGYDCGPADGQDGARTRRAVDAFCARVGLAPGTGWQEREFLDALASYHDRVDVEPNN